jgi:hypothetical protein
VLFGRESGQEQHQQGRMSPASASEHYPVHSKPASTLTYILLGDARDGCVLELDILYGQQQLHPGLLYDQLLVLSSPHF